MSVLQRFGATVVALLIGGWGIVGCTPTPQSILSKNDWRCGNTAVLRFEESGVVSTTLASSVDRHTYRSGYKLIDGEKGLLARIQLEDDAPMRALFGGSAPLNVLDIGYEDFHIVLTHGGHQEVCSPIRSH